MATEKLLSAMKTGTQLVQYHMWDNRTAVTKACVFAGCTTGTFVGVYATPHLSRVPGSKMYTSSTAKYAIRVPVIMASSIMAGALMGLGIGELALLAWPAWPVVLPPLVVWAFCPDFDSSSFSKRFPHKV